jgi:hypothetical protein
MGSSSCLGVGFHYFGFHALLIENFYFYGLAVRIIGLERGIGSCWRYSVRFSLAFLMYSFPMGCDI